VAAFEAILAGASEDYRLGKGPDFFHPFDAMSRDEGAAIAPAAAAVAAS
jgi:hypothetical protein